eukprot:gene11274-4087_t
MLKTFIKQQFKNFRYKRHNFTNFFEQNKLKSSTDPSPGLYSIQNLNQPKDFHTKAEEATNKIQNYVTEILSTEIKSVSNAKKIISSLDDISNELCLVLDPCSLCSVSHPKDEWINAANETMQNFGSLLHGLNTNTGIHQKMCEILQHEKIFEQLGEQEKRLVKLFKQDMEKQGGSHLSEANKMKVIQINQNIDIVIMNLTNAINDSEYENSEKLLKELINLRHDLASILEYPSYSHLFLSDQMIQKPEKVEDFLNEIYSLIQEKIQFELQLLETNLPKEEAKNLTTDNFYAKSRKISKHLTQVKPLAAYFSLENCFNGLNLICQRLFGITLKPCEVHPNEIWHEDVRKIEFHHETEGNLGHLYLDLFAREKKIDASATSTIAVGKKISESEYQNPIAALLISYSKMGKITFLNLQEVETLFHEFGHALHTILGRTDFQNTSGTRTTLDFIETPSQFMEHFALDYRVVSQFAKHHQTGEIIPEELLNRYKVEKNLFSCLKIEREIIKSIIDVKMYGVQNYESFSKISNEVLTNYSSLAFTNSDFHVTIHSTNYAAGYYSYTYSKVFSSHIWHKYFANDPLNREAGERLRRKFLQYGGIKSPKEILLEMLEEEPNPKYLIKDLI